MQFRVLVGDITQWPADAIVNSASPTLLDVSPLDFRLYRAAGPAFTSACAGKGGCRFGDAKVVKAYKLPASYVIQAVGPYWRGGSQNEAKELASAYQKALLRAREKGVRHIAFTSLSTEEKKYPLAQAAAIAVPLLYQQGQDLERLDMVCPTQAVQDAYVKAAVQYWLQRIQETPAPQQRQAVTEAALALAVITMAHDVPDPFILADMVRDIQLRLHEFTQQKQELPLVAVDQTAAAIMAIYSGLVKGDFSHE